MYSKLRNCGKKAPKQSIYKSNMMAFFCCCIEFSYIRVRSSVYLLSIYYITQNYLRLSTGLHQFRLNFFIVCSCYFCPSLKICPLFIIGKDAPRNGRFKACSESISMNNLMLLLILAIIRRYSKTKNVQVRVMFKSHF